MDRKEKDKAREERRAWRAEKAGADERINVSKARGKDGPIKVKFTNPMDAARVLLYVSAYDHHPVIASIRDQLMEAIGPSFYDEHIDELDEEWLDRPREATTRGDLLL